MKENLISLLGFVLICTEYKNSSPIPISRNEVVKIFSAGSSAEICKALLAIALYEDDWKWVQMQCLHFLKNSNSDVSGLAATCLGPTAGIHHKLDRELVISALKARLGDMKISRCVQDALEDIEMFL